MTGSVVNFERMEWESQEHKDFLRFIAGKLELSSVLEFALENVNVYCTPEMAKRDDCANYAESAALVLSDLLHINGVTLSGGDSVELLAHWLDGHPYSDWYAGDGDIRHDLSAVLGEAGELWLNYLEWAEEAPLPYGL